MHPVIYLNRTMVEATKARVAPVSSAMLYGRGVFTTVAIYNGVPFLWPKHWRRLLDHAGRLAIDCSGCTEQGVGEALEKLISVNRVRDGQARVILLARSGRDFWKTKTPGRQEDRPADPDRGGPKNPPGRNESGRLALSLQHFFTSHRNQKFELSGAGPGLGGSSSQRI